MRLEQEADRQEKLRAEEAVHLELQQAQEAMRIEKLRIQQETQKRIAAEEAKRETELRQAEEAAKIKQLQALQLEQLEQLRKQNDIVNDSREPDAELAETENRYSIETTT